MLTPGTIRRTAVIMLGLSLAWLYFLYGRGVLVVDGVATPIAHDYLAHITGGKIALTGEMSRLYDAQFQQEIERGYLIEPDVPFFNAFISPPFVAFLYAPFALLPYNASVLVWCLLSLALIGASAGLVWPLAPALHSFGRAGTVLVILSSQATLGLWLGAQDTAVSLFIFALGLRLLADKRDLPAGAVLALGLFKPQLFLLMPVLLFGLRRWRALAGWAAMAGLLAAISLAAIGFDGIQSYLALLRSDVYRVQLSGTYAWKIQSFGAFVSFFAPGVWNDAVSGLWYAMGGLVVFWLARRASQTGEEPALPTLFALAMLLTLLATPHLYGYDLLLVALPAMLTLHASRLDRTVMLLWTAFYIVNWLGPFLAPAFRASDGPARLLSTPWSILLVAMVAVVVIGRLPGWPARRLSAEPARP